MRRHPVAFALVALTMAAVLPHSGIRAQDAGKAADLLAAARGAIGQKSLELVKTLSVQAAVTRTIAQREMNSAVEMLLEMPDKYVRSDESTGGPANYSSKSGFNGSRTLSTSPGGMTFRIGPNGPLPTEKPTPGQSAEMSKASLRSARHEISRMTLGWFAAAHPSVNATYTHAGEAEGADGKADVIDVKGDDGFAARLFIDRTTRLPLMVTYQGPRRVVMTRSMDGTRVVTPLSGAGTPDQVTMMTRRSPGEGAATAAGGAAQPMEGVQRQPPQMVEYRLYFGDWSAVDGIRFPLKIQRAVDGVAEEEWTVTSVKVNRKIDAKKFAPKE